MKMTFKQFLTEIYVDPDDKDAVRQIKHADILGKKKAALKNAEMQQNRAKKAEINADMAHDPQEKMIAKRKAQLEQQKAKIAKKEASLAKHGDSEDENI